MGQMPDKVGTDTWKYPRQDTKFQIVMPGRVFKLDPNHKNLA